MRRGHFTVALALVGRPLSAKRAVPYTDRPPFFSISGGSAQVQRAGTNAATMHVDHMCINLFSILCTENHDQSMFHIVPENLFCVRDRLV